MPDRRSINVVSAATGAPLAGLSPTALAWSFPAGAVRTPPDVEDAGGGEYQFEPTAADEEVGTLVLIDFGAGALPRYVACAVFEPDNSNQFWCVVVTNPDANSTLWAGAAPTVDRFQWGAVDRLAQAPNTTPVPAGSTSLFGWRPSSDDISNDASIRIAGPAGSAQPYWSDDVRPVVVPDALPTEGLAQAVFAALSTYAPLTALIATRAYPNLLPQNVTLPACVYRVISNVPESSLTGLQGDTVSQARVQVTAWSRTYKEAHLVAAGVKAALGDLKEPSPGLSVWPANESDLYDDETRLHGVSQDFNVWR